MRVGRRTLLIGVLLAFALGGCVTAYQPAGMTGGYKDEKLADDTYRVSFGGNGYTSRLVVLKYFLYRCAELTLQHGYAYFKLYSARRVSLGSPVLASPFVRTAYRAPTVIYIPGARVTTYSATGVIRMYPKDIMIVGPDLFDARDVVATLGAEVRSGNSNPSLPARYRRIKGGFPVLPTDDQSVAPDSSLPAPAPASGPVRLDDLKDLMQQ